MSFNTEWAKIEFSHPEMDHEELLKFNISIPSHDTRRCTVVNIISLETGDVLSKGISVCHEIDNFNKSVGRKNALTHAVSIYSKSFRKQIWDAYNKQIGRN